MAAILNPFVPDAPFLYPLETSENRNFFWCFQGVEKECIGNKWVNESNLVPDFQWINKDYVFLAKRESKFLNKNKKFL